MNQYNFDENLTFTFHDDEQWGSKRSLKFKSEEKRVQKTHKKKLKKLKGYQKRAATARLRSLVMAS